MCVDSSPVKGRPITLKKGDVVKSTYKYYKIVDIDPGSTQPIVFSHGYMSVGEAMIATEKVFWYGFDDISWIQEVFPEVTEEQVAAFGRSFEGMAHTYADGKPLFSVSHTDFVFDKVPVGEVFTAPGMVWGSSYASILVDLPTTVVRPRLWHRLAMLREKRIERRYNR